MKKPVNLIYGVEERPPLGVTLLGALQHVVLIAARLPLPLIVSREAGLPPERVVDLLSVTMIVSGVATVLQARGRGPVGSGFLAPTSTSSLYFPPALLAARAGGMSLVSGLTLFGGVVESLLSRFLRPLRPYFPAEISGLVVVMVAVTLGALGIRNVLGIDTAEGLTSIGASVAAVSLGTMLGLNVWGRGPLRLCCALIGMAVGYLAAAIGGILTTADLGLFERAPLFHLPNLAHGSWSFDIGLAIPFAVAALAASIRSVGDITTCQKINDEEWVRPDMRSISGGVLANGLGTVSAGLLGTLGVNVMTSSVGLTSVTGVTSRGIARWIGLIFLALAFHPKAAALFAIMPRPVIGATLLFAACSVFVNGLQIITSRMLDARRTFVIGLSFMIGLAVDFYPAFFRGLPAKIQPIIGSSLVLGTVAALLLNLVFRLGVRKTQTILVHPAQLDPETVEAFIEAHGSAWGARRDVMDRAGFNLVQAVETIVESCGPKGPVEIEASFDEFKLDVRVSYDGAPLELPEARPSNEEIMASEHGERRLAGFMLRRYADRVQASHKAGRSAVLFHFDH